MIHAILITGSRDWMAVETIENILRAEVAKAMDMGRVPMVIHGDHWDGADNIAELFCERSGVRSLKFPAQWKLKGRAAGPLRNEEMVEVYASIIGVSGNTGAAYAFPMVHSTGTRDCITALQRRNFQVKVLEG